MRKIIYYSLIFIFGMYSASYAGNIKGKVTMPENPPRKKTGGLSSLYTNPSQHSAHAQQQQSSSMAVLFLKTFKGQSKPKLIENAKLTQQNQMFEPHVIVVTVGSTVGFPNADNVYHNVFSFSKTKTFDLGRYAQGKSKSVTFDKPGIVDVFCEIHSSMRAFIIVVPNDYYTTPDENGEFTISNVPAGTFTIGAWHELYPYKEYEITVPETGDVGINIDL